MHVCLGEAAGAGGGGGLRNVTSGVILYKRKANGRERKAAERNLERVPKRSARNGGGVSERFWMALVPCTSSLYALNRLSPLSMVTPHRKWEVLVLPAVVQPVVQPKLHRSGLPGRSPAGPVDVLGMCARMSVSLSVCWDGVWGCLYECMNVWRWVRPMWLRLFAGLLRCRSNRFGSSVRVLRI